MPALTQLKLAQYVRPAAVSPIQQRRLKLIRRLREQMQLASAVESGTPHTATRLRTVVDPETGVKQSVVVPKRVKSWWSSAESGRVILTVRYGSKLLEFSKGKAAIEVASMQQLVPTLQVLCDAVSSGELDAQLEIASNKLKAGFGR